MTQANLFPVCEKAIRLNKECRDPLAWHIYQLQLVNENAHEFDVIHFHNDYLHFPLSAQKNYRHVTTLHGRLDLPDLKPIYKKFYDIPVISISNNQRNPLLYANWIETVYHGVPPDLYQKGTGEGGYLAFIGRISPEKRPDLAIEIAKKAGIKLKIAAKVDKADEEYFENHIKALLDDPLVEFIGEIGDEDKSEFLGNALALLFPIDWPEPFGMVMIEALAAGTPVIAFNKGSVPEIIGHGKTGFIVNNTAHAVKAVEQLNKIDRNVCRQVFEERFTAKIMAENYVKVYERLNRKPAKIFRFDDVQKQFVKSS